VQRVCGCEKRVWYVVVCAVYGIGVCGCVGVVFGGVCVVV